MSTELAINNVKEIATTFINSGLFLDTKSVEVAIVKIFAGKEFGLEPFQSMQSLDIIQGKVFIKPQLLAGLIKQSKKYDYRIIESNNLKCSIDFFENGDCIGTSIVTFEDCTRMQLTGKDNWKKQPGTMLYNRAMSQGARRYTPDLFLMPIYTEGDEWTSQEACKPPIEHTKIVMISKQQRANLFKVMSDYNYGKDKLIEFIKTNWGVEKSTDLTEDMYEECILEMESSVINAEYEQELIQSENILFEKKEVGTYGND